MTMAIAHRQKDGPIVLDCIRERRPPFSPESVTAEFCETLKAYRITKVTGDRYGGEWPREQFRKSGISYEPSEKTRSDIYRECLPLLNAKGVELLDSPRLATQLLGLERRTARGGKDSIDHAPGAHDDLCNAACGAVLLGQTATPDFVLPAGLLDKIRERGLRSRTERSQTGQVHYREPRVRIY
jgi:hypothetical protein